MQMYLIRNSEYANAAAELTHLILKNTRKKGKAVLLRTVQFHEPAESAMFTFPLHRRREMNALGSL